MTHPDPSPQVLITEPWPDYALVDSGEGRKLERLGRFLIDRPEPQAMWVRTDPKIWHKANATFTAGSDDDDSDTGKGRWQFTSPPPETFPLAWQDVGFLGRFTAFRHLAVFPEQAAHWQTIQRHARAANRPLKVLNLFGYTGLASLAAAQAGAEVTHVDASKKALQWGKDNQAAAGLQQAKIRWLLDDAQKFVAREVRRGHRYDGIILDPPKYGRGPKGERWQVFDDLPQLMADCGAILADDAKFFILTGYAARLSCLSLLALAQQHVARVDGQWQCGELALREELGGRLLSTALYAKWECQVGGRQLI